MLLCNSPIITCDSETRVVDRGWLRTRGNVIAALGDGAPPAPKPGERVIDCEGAVLLPGLVNTHVHSFQTLLRGYYDHLPLLEYLRYVYRCGEELTAEDARSSGRLAAMEALRSGVTTLVDHHFLNRTPELAAATIEGARSVGVRMVLARTSMDCGDGLPAAIKEQPERAAANTDELMRVFRRSIDDGTVHVMSGANTPGINASAALVREISAYAADRGLTCSSHVAEYAEVRSAVRNDYGIDGVVRWLATLGALGPRLLAVHAVHVDSSEIELMREAAVSVSHNPFSNLFCGPTTAPVSDYLAAGLRVGLGTDGAANNNGLDIFDAARITRILERANPERAGISVAQTLQLATSNGAKALGLDHMIGSLEPGKRADIVAVGTDAPHMTPMFVPDRHIAYFGKGSDARHVIADGELVVEDGVFVRHDAVGSRRTADECARALVARLG